jgi:hypothetical protein
MKDLHAAESILFRNDKCIYNDPYGALTATATKVYFKGSC